LAECHHEFVSVLARDGDRLVETPLKICKKCNALRIGNTIDITADYIEFPLLTADPAGAEGRICYRADLDQMRYHDGVEWRPIVLRPSGTVNSIVSIPAGTKLTLTIKGLIFVHLPTIYEEELTYIILYHTPSATDVRIDKLRTTEGDFGMRAVAYPDLTKIENAGTYTWEFQIFLWEVETSTFTVDMPGFGTFIPDPCLFSWCADKATSIDWWDGTTWLELMTLRGNTIFADGSTIRLRDESGYAATRLFVVI